MSGGGRLVGGGGREEVKRSAGACRGQTYQSDSDMIAETLQAATLTAANYKLSKAHTSLYIKLACSLTMSEEPSSCSPPS